MNFGREKQFNHVFALPVDLISFTLYDADERTQES